MGETKFNYKVQFYFRSIEFAKNFKTKINQIKTMKSSYSTIIKWLLVNLLFSWFTWQGNADKFTLGYLTGSYRRPWDKEYSRPGLSISGEFHQFNVNSLILRRIYDDDDESLIPCFVLVTYFSKDSFVNSLGGV